MTTLREVADVAGVSPATASRVLNGNPQVSDELRRRVEEAVAKVGYEPPGVRRRRTAGQVVALVVPHVSSPFYCEILSGVEREAFQSGYDLVFYTTEGRSHQNVIDRVLHAPQVAGLVVITPRHGEEKMVSAHPEAPPVVVVDHHSGGSKHPHVMVDNLRGAHRAVEYLLSQGYDDIAMIRGPETIQSSVDRIRGFMLALQEAGRPASPADIWPGDFEQRSGFEVVAERLSRGDAMPRALFCANDLMALGAIAALRDAGKRVPEDVAVMGFDDLPVAASSVPGLTTMRQSAANMGAIAFRMVMRLAVGEVLETDRVVLDTELVVRGSA